MDASRLNTPQFIYDDNECHVISYTPLMVTNSDGATFAQTDPNSHYFTDLNQVLESLKYIKYLSYHYLIIGVQNSIDNGFEILNKNDKVGIYTLQTLKQDLINEKSAVQLTKMLKYLLKNNCNIMESEPVR